MTRSEKAISGNFPPMPDDHPHSALPKPGEPTISNLNDVQKEAVAIWLQRVKNGRNTADLSDLDESAHAKIAEFQTYFASDAYLEHKMNDLAVAHAEWRLRMVDAIEAVHAARGKPVTDIPISS